MCRDCSCSLKAVDPVAPMAPAAPVAPRRLLPLHQQLLEHNQRRAEANRRRFRRGGVLVVNLLSSPGSGKTALLESLARLAPGGRAALVGDLSTSLDAERLRRSGLPAVALNTGQACHLDAAMVARGITALEAEGHPLTALEQLLIENVGNLVCPAAYDLGEALRLVLLAVGEGEDKPLKYPAVFRSAHVVVITKVDLSTAVAFQREAALANIQAVAPKAVVLECSARSGAGLPELQALLVSQWLQGLQEGTDRPEPPPEATVALGGR